MKNPLFSALRMTKYQRRVAAEASQAASKRTMLPLMQLASSDHHADVGWLRPQALYGSLRLLQCTGWCRCSGNPMGLAMTKHR